MSRNFILTKLCEVENLPFINEILILTMRYFSDLMIFKLYWHQVNKNKVADILRCGFMNVLMNDNVDVQYAVMLLTYRSWMTIGIFSLDIKESILTI